MSTEHKMLVFSAREYDREFLTKSAKKNGIELKFVEARLDEETARLAEGYKAICIFVNDLGNEAVIDKLASVGVKFIALRCAGFNNVDLKAAEKHKICVARVPAYSPYAVSEHTVGLMLALNRKIHRAHMRVRDGNFALNGLLGFDMHGKTVGVIGTGRIGALTAKALLLGFGCKIIAYDKFENDELKDLGVTYGSLEDVYAKSDIISLHCPLMPETYHLVSSETIPKMKKGVMIINTSRGALIDAAAAIEALKAGQIGAMGLDVYEEEADLFFEDLSNRVITDDVFARMLTMPNVIITGHQAYFTREALNNIADTTMGNVLSFFGGKGCENAVFCDRIRKSKRMIKK